ncbi:MAG TPA: methyltransferase domain-containing protein [Acidimicrobiia bacterium]|nr:methyltransferase domain-containing protein [Acidimicrobiia bacterium]
MRIHAARYLDNGLGFNHGQPATLIEIERFTDYDDLLAYIVDSNFYGDAYLRRQSGQTDDRLIAHFWWLADTVAALQPHRVLEIGCGRGDVLRLLHEAHGIEVAGIDFGSSVSDRMWPSVRANFHAGEIREVLQTWSGPAYDLAGGFDIWEHLHPRDLDETIELLVEHSTRDALFVFVIPAFGTDEVFGEQFPLEFEENRDAFEHREPFRFLLSDPSDEKVPAAGHLTWAHTDWWVARFVAKGLVREPRVERALHPIIDPHVPHSIKSFYVFRRDTPEARARIEHWHGPRVKAAAGLQSLARREYFRRRRHAEFNVGTRVEFGRWWRAQGPVIQGAARTAGWTKRQLSRLTPGK